MKNLKGNIKLLTSNINIEEKKKLWLSTVKGNETTNIKGINSKSLKDVALSFFKEKNIYNEENLIVLHLFCKEKLDEYLINEELTEFLQKTFLLYEYFIEEKCNKINKKEFIENVCDCCKRLFLKNIIRYEKDILDFLLKNLINFISKYSFFHIYQSLYNIYQYQNKHFTKPREYKNEKFQFLLNIQHKEVNGEYIMINNNTFDLNAFFLLDENDEKQIREHFYERESDQYNDNNDGYDNFCTLQSVEKLEKEYTKKGKKKEVSEKPMSTKKKGTTIKNIDNPLCSNHSKCGSSETNCLQKEFTCFYLFIYFKSCFENINFYLIEKFIENYYINHNNENIYKELLLFLFLIYKNKMNNIIDRILTDTIKYSNIMNDVDIKKKKKKLLNDDETDLVDRKLYVSDCLFYFELLINIITYKNLQYENNYEYYINILKLLHENDTFQELFISSLFFVFISIEEVNTRNMVLMNFMKYHSKKYYILSKLFIHMKNVFSVIYDIDSEHIIYNRSTFNSTPNVEFVHSDKQKDSNINDSYLLHIANNIHIDKYVCLFFREIYYIISRSNMDYFCYITNLYLYIYDNIFNKIINIIYENEMNLNDNSFHICTNILRPFLFIYSDLFNNFSQKLKKKIFNERVMIYYSFIKKYLFKNMYEKTFLQKDLFYVIYQIYFLLHTLKYNFLNFLTCFITTKRKINEYLEYFLKLKVDNSKQSGGEKNVDEAINSLHDKCTDDGTQYMKHEYEVGNSALEIYEEGGKESEQRDELLENNEKEEEDSGRVYDPISPHNANTKKRNTKKSSKRPCKEGSTKESEKMGKQLSEKEQKNQMSNILNNETDDKGTCEGTNYAEDKKKRITGNIVTQNFANATGNNSICINKEEKEKMRIITFFEKNYLLLKYFKANTESTLDENYTPDFNVNDRMKENTKLKKIIVNNNIRDIKSRRNIDSKCKSKSDGKHSNSNCNNHSYNNTVPVLDEKLRFMKKLNSFFNKCKEIDEPIIELFLNNKDNVYSKILKTNLLIIKELRNIRMDILYPIFNASLVFLFDDFYFFIIQNIKLIVEEKEKKLSNHKIFLNMSFILLHILVKDVKIEKYLVSIFYMLKLTLNKLKLLKILDQTKSCDMKEIYNKNTKKFENNIKYYNIKKDKNIIKTNSQEKQEDDEKSDSLCSINERGTSLRTTNKQFIHSKSLEEKIKLYQNVFFIFLKLLQNILKVNNLYYNFKFIIYDILFSEYSNKTIIFSCLKCILDRSKLEEVYNYCIDILGSINVGKGKLEQLLKNGNNSSGIVNNTNDYDTNEKGKAVEEKKEDVEGEKREKKKIVKKQIGQKKKTNKKDNYHVNTNNHKCTNPNYSLDECKEYVSERGEENNVVEVAKQNLTNVVNPSYLSFVLLNRESLKINFFDPENVKNSRISTLYINILILYYIFSQKNKNNEKTKLYDSSIKLSIENYYNIINKLVCVLYQKNCLNAHYDTYTKYLCLKVFKRIYNLLCIQEADIYIKYLRSSDTQGNIMIYEDKKLNNIKSLKNELVHFFEYISNNEIKKYFKQNKINNIIKSKEYAFFFLNNLKCNNIILNEENFFFMINCLLFLFNIKYDKGTFYKVVCIILIEKNKNGNYILTKIISSIKKFFKLSEIFNGVRKENKKNKIRLSSDITNHSALLYIIRTTIILLLLIDYSSINGQEITNDDDSLTYSMFINDYIKKKSLKHYYTQLNFLLFRIFYNEKNLPYFFKIFFSTLYIISFKKSNDKVIYFFENVFHIREDTNLEALKGKPNEWTEERPCVRTDEGANEKETKNNHTTSNNKDLAEVNHCKGNITSHNRDTKRKYVKKENSEEDENNSISDDGKKNYHIILRNQRQTTKNLPDKNKEKSMNSPRNGESKNYIKIVYSSSSNSSSCSDSDSDVSYKINIKNNNKRKNKIASNNKKKKVKKVSSVDSTNISTVIYEQDTNKKSNDDNGEKKGNIKEEILEHPLVKQSNNKKSEENKLHTNGEKNKISQNFQFNGTLSAKILNHFLFLCKGFHEDLELKIYNGIITHLRENESDREKLKNLLRLNFSEDDKKSIKYIKKLELLNVIDTKIIFLKYIKHNLKKRKTLLSRMSDLNLNIFKYKSMFHIELDLI
ncbi:conserved Plasmodium protein, unknown function [Plasmodium malariae]|uniref:Uncharacterized protein n=1 Tax=Plasmodium malariae TaxID=5858 RepID=A0A1A8VZZ2_PLAMA|nr:conserved Plasmodium protein, unknown function [Plasmodium malariae]SBS84468.1 conserved Plasmodium protein, unknown function [Plasmodium malariae]SCN12171.1 conserved Plasmodium protein, unknown function [Plasmodium malariae]